MVKLYFKYKEIINYLIFGVLTTIVSLATYYLLTISILDPKVSLELQLANVVSWCFAVLFAYFTNRAFVFNSHNQNKLKEFTSFIGARITTLILDMAIMFFFVTVLKGNDRVFKLVSQVVVIVGNYILSKLFVFKKDSDEKNN